MWLIRHQICWNVQVDKTDLMWAIWINLNLKISKVPINLIRRAKVSYLNLQVHNRLFIFVRIHQSLFIDWLAASQSAHFRKGKSMPLLIFIDYPIVVSKPGQNNTSTFFRSISITIRTWLIANNANCLNCWWNYLFCCSLSRKSHRRNNTCRNYYIFFEYF